MSRLVCLGILVKDMVFRVPKIPPVPQKLTASDLRVQFGGMAATAAAAAAALGGEVEFWGRIGDDDTGREAERALRARGIEPRLSVTAGVASPTAAIFVDESGERMLAVHSGGLDADPGWLPITRLQGAGAVHADFRWPQGSRALYEAARARGIPRVLDADAGNPDAVRELMVLADHVVFSERGLAGLCDDLPPQEALCQLPAAPGQVLGVTLGERGSLFLHDGQMRAFSAPHIAPRDTNGAGDVFHGAYALALARGLPWPQAVDYATAAASLKCMRDHDWAQLPGHDEVLSFMHAQGNQGVTARAAG